MNTPSEEADWIANEVKETEKILRQKGSSGNDYAEAYGRLRIVIAHAEGVIRAGDPAHGLIHDGFGRLLSSEEYQVVECSDDHGDSRTRIPHTHHRRRLPKDGLHK